MREEMKTKKSIYSIMIQASMMQQIIVRKKRKGGN